MANTGNKGWLTLEEYFIDNDQPTGNTKSNAVTDPNYVAPVLDINTCPIQTYSSTRSTSFTKQCSGQDKGSIHTFTKVYVSSISQQDAFNQSQNDSNYLIEGQNYANQVGTCTGPVYVWGKITNEDIFVASNGLTYATIMLRTYKGMSGTIAPDPVTSEAYPCTNGSIAVTFKQMGSYPIDNNFAVGMSNQTSVQLIAPNTQKFNPYWPKMLINTNDGTYLYMVFTNKANGEMVLLQTVY